MVDNKSSTQDTSPIEIDLFAEDVEVISDGDVVIDLFDESSDEAPPARSDAPDEPASVDIDLFAEDNLVEVFMEGEMVLIPKQGSVPFVHPGKQDIPANLMEFLGQNDSPVIELLDDEAPVLSNSTALTVPEPRIGSEMSPQESAANLTLRYGKTIDVLTRILKAGQNHASEDSKAMSNIIEHANLVFLKPHQISTLIGLFYTSKDKKTIIDVFCKEYRLTPAKKLQLSAAVEKMLRQYEDYSKNFMARWGVKSTSGLDLGPVINKAEKDMNDLQSHLHKNNVTYVTKVIETSDGVDFICGRCAATSHSEEDFVNVIVHENIGERDNYIQLFPRGNVCSSCGTANVLTSAEHAKISSLLNKEYRDQLVRWAPRSKKKMSSGTNVIYYSPPKSRFPQYYPYLFTEKIEEAQERYSTVESGLSIMGQWYDETRELLKSLDVYTGPGEGGYAFKDGKFGVIKEQVYPALVGILRSYCDMFSEDFDTLYYNATNTLLLYLQESPTLALSLSNSGVYATSFYEVYNSYIGQDFGEDTEEVYEGVFRHLGVSVDSSKLKSIGDPVIRAELDELLKTSLEEEKEYNELCLKVQREALDSLEDLVPLFRVLKINSVPKIPDNELKPLLSVPEVIDWIHEVALLMIMHRVSPGAYQLWKTKSIPDYKHESLFNKGVKKTFSELLTTLFKKYSEYHSTLAKGPKVKSLDLVSGDFISKYAFDGAMANRFYNLMESISSGDLFSFYAVIQDIGKRLHPTGKAFERMKDFISQQLPKAKKFFEGKDPSSDKDFYEYHYGSMFSEEEMAEVVKSGADRVKRPVEIARLDGETFSEYLARLKSVEIGTTSDQSLGKDYKFFIGIRGIIPSIYAIFEYIKVVGQGKESIRQEMFIGDAIYHSQMLGSHLMYDFIGIPVPSSEQFTPPEHVLSTLDPIKTQLEYMLKEVVFPSREMNLLISGSTEESYDIFSYMAAYPEDVAAACAQMGEFGGLVIEHYLS